MSPDPPDPQSETVSRKHSLSHALEQLKSDAEKLEQLAAVVEAGTDEPPRERAPEAFRDAAMRLESSTIAFAVRLLHLVARADRMLALAELEREWALENPDQSDPRTRARILREKRAVAIEAVASALVTFGSTEAPLSVMELARQMASDIVDQLSEYAVAKLKVELC